MMKFTKTFLVAMVLSSGMAFGYDEVTDQTGATEPPKGPGDDSFVQGIYPETEDEKRRERQAQTEPEEPRERVVERERPAPVQAPLSAEERQQVSQERRERYMLPQSKGASLDPHQEQENQTAILILRYDRDRDGTLNRDEIQNNNELDNSFTELDADNDGALSAEELSDWDGLETINE